MSLHMCKCMHLCGYIISDRGLSALWYLSFEDINPARLFHHIPDPPNERSPGQAASPEWVALTVLWK